MQKGPKAQSAIEFITTYSTVLLIITVAIAVLFLFISLPKSILPTECNFYNSFGCFDAIYGINYTSSNVPTGTALLVVANFEEPGIINTSSFSAFVGGVESNSGYCAPKVALQGQKVYCIAFFNGQTLSPGKLYSGTFSIYANYCAVAPSKISTAYCPPPNATSYYKYGGVVRTQGVLQTIGGIYAVPINVTINNFNFFDWFFLSFIEPGYQVPISFNPKNTSYVLHESPDLGNIRFYYNNQELYDWCQNCNDSMTSNAIFWVKMPQSTFGIFCFFGSCPSKTQILMYFTPISTTFSGVHSGLAPMLTTPYGKYDNGQLVFNYYTDFLGTSIPSSWTDMLGDNYSIHNGLYFNGKGVALLEKLNDYPIDVYNITEASITMQTPGAGGLIFGVNGSAQINQGPFDNHYCNGPYNNTWINVGLSANDLCYGETFSVIGGDSLAVDAGSSTTVDTSVPTSGTYTIGLANGFFHAYYFYNNTLQEEENLPFVIFGYFGIESDSANFKVNWVRSIAMLPGGEQPQITFGPIIKESGP
ncbi:MAG: hypothetical protein QW814_00010 [Methanothrix sp.]